jgi:hypothetical protein
MNSPEIKAFIREKSSLFWHIPEDKKENVSQDVLVEYILNYGSMDDIRKLLEILGLKRVSGIFFDAINKSDRKKNNYHDLTINYFTLFFEKYANKHPHRKTKRTVALS